MRDSPPLEAQTALARTSSCKPKRCRLAQGQNLALTVIHVPHSLGSGSACAVLSSFAPRWGFGGHAVPFRCRASMAHIRQSGPDSGLGLKGKVLKTFQVVPSSLAIGVNVSPSLRSEGTSSARCQANLGHRRQSRPDSGLVLIHVQCESRLKHFRCSLLARQRTCAKGHAN